MLEEKFEDDPLMFLIFLNYLVVPASAYVSIKFIWEILCRHVIGYFLGLLL